VTASSGDGAVTSGRRARSDDAAAGARRSIQLAISDDSAVGQEGRGEAGERDERVTPPMMTNTCSASVIDRPAASSWPNESRTGQCGPQAALDEDRVEQRASAMSAGEAELLAERRDDEVGAGERHQVREALAEAGAEDAAVGEAEQRLHDLVAGTSFGVLSTGPATPSTRSRTCPKA